MLVPREGEPSIIFPAEARYVGEHGDSQISDQVFADRPGEWLAERLRGQRVGVYGLDYVMVQRDYAALHGACDLVNWDLAFDHARAVKSDEELHSVRDSVRINTEGFHAFRDAYEPGRSAAEVLAIRDRVEAFDGSMLEVPTGSPQSVIAAVVPLALTDTGASSVGTAGEQWRSE